jgi:hypothetical protein
MFKQVMEMVDGHILILTDGNQNFQFKGMANVHDSVLKGSDNKSDIQSTNKQERIKVTIP